MRLALASDHAGFDLKQELLAFLAERGYDLQDLGTHSKAVRATAVQERVRATFLLLRTRGLRLCCRLLLGWLVYRLEPRYRPLAPFVINLLL